MCDMYVCIVCIYMVCVVCMHVYGVCVCGMICIYMCDKCVCVCETVQLSTVHICHFHVPVGGHWGGFHGLATITAVNIN